MNDCSVREVEAFTLDSMVELFSDQMQQKLRHKQNENRAFAWASPEWTEEQIRQRLIEHVEKGDPVDVANLAMFWWQRLNENAE